MQLCDVFRGLGEQRFFDLVRSISIGKLKTFQMYERMKARLHTNKLNSEFLKKAGPRLWARLDEQEDDYATDLAQAVLISHMDMIKDALDHLGVPHEEGFFAKDADVSGYLKDGWQASVFEALKGKYPEAALVFYINHLGWEVTKSEQLFQPAA
jgi:hypothetical protein